MPARLLVFGRSGQVARALAAAPAEFEVELAGRERIDLAQPAPDVAGLIAAVRPVAVINAAAYTAVDRAEAEPEACARLNRDAVAAIGRACADAAIPLIHFSTDYVFDGEKGAPYIEADPRRPLNVYGRTKGEGEAALEALWAAGAAGAVIRSSWIFSAGGASFLQTMLRLARERDEVAVVADQWGCPTPALACAEAALALTRLLLDRDQAGQGMFHAAGADSMTWADFAQAIFAASAARGGPAAEVRRIASKDYPTAAVRPRDTRLDSAHLAACTGWRAPPFAAALAHCLASMESP
jgi:dTDP-4-dehydrorhamnose reductase